MLPRPPPGQWDGEQVSRADGDTSDLFISSWVSGCPGACNSQGGQVVGLLAGADPWVHTDPEVAEWGWGFASGLRMSVPIAKGGSVAQSSHTWAGALGTPGSSGQSDQ